MVRIHFTALGFLKQKQLKEEVNASSESIKGSSRSTCVNELFHTQSTKITKGFDPHITCNFSDIEKTPVMNREQSLQNNISDRDYFISKTSVSSLSELPKENVYKHGLKQWSCDPGTAVINKASSNKNEVSASELLRKLYEKLNILNEKYKSYISNMNQNHAKLGSFGNQKNKAKDCAEVSIPQDAICLCEAPKHFKSKSEETLSGKEYSRLRIFISTAELRKNNRPCSVKQLTLPTSCTEKGPIRSETSHSNEELDYSGFLSMYDADKVILRSLACLKEYRLNYGLTKLHQFKNRTASNECNKGGIFGVSLLTVQRFSPGTLPKPITQCMKFLLSVCRDHEDLFRKPAIQSRIIELRKNLNFETSLSLTSEQAFVIADVIRQYLRELPESLVPRCYSKLLRDATSMLPEEERKKAITCILFSMPDTHRMATESVLRFLKDFVDKCPPSYKVNHQTLARLFVPSVFHSYPAKVKFQLSSHKRFMSMRKMYDMEQSVLENCLLFMITNVDELFEVSKFISRSQRTIYKPKCLQDIICEACDEGSRNVESYVKQDIKRYFQNIHKESTGKRYVDIKSNNIHIRCHKTSKRDAIPLVWICELNVGASVEVIANNILNQRNQWDNDFSDFRLVEKFEGAEIIQYVLKPFYPLSSRSFCEFRYAQWINTDRSLKQQWLIIGCRSIDHVQNRFLPGIKACVAYTYILLKPLKNNQSRLHLSSKVDWRGCSSSWYKEVYAYKLLRNLENLRNFCEEK